MTRFKNRHLRLFGRVSRDRLYPMYVPTYTRAGVAPFLEMLNDAPSWVKNRVWLVVRPEEQNAYQAAYPWAKQVLVKRPGLGPARTRALKHAQTHGHTRLVMLDDDINHVSLLQRVTQDNGKDHTRRYSSRVTGIPEPLLTLNALTVACVLADGVFHREPDAVYGACRNALFSGDVDTDLGATLNKGTFPASVMFYDVTRMENITLPKDFHMHGEDVAFALDVMSRGQLWFTLPAVAFDQSGTIETTIPLDPTDSEARRVDIRNAEMAYPDLHPYLRESMKNKAGGVMRVGMYWHRWYKDTESDPIEIPMKKLMPKEAKR